MRQNFENLGIEVLFTYAVFTGIPRSVNFSFDL